MQAIDNDILRAILQGQLSNMAAEERERAAKISIEQVNNTLKKANIDNLPEVSFLQKMKMKKHLKELNEDGITFLGKVLSSKQIKEIHGHLKEKKAYASHVWTFSDKIARTTDEIRKYNKQACYVLEDTLNTPHILSTLSDPFILKLVEQYIGCLPTVFQSNLMWSFHSENTPPGIAQGFHRDWDNFKFCVLFIYLTDVDKDTGPHNFIKGSHRVEKIVEAVEKFNKTSSNKVDVETYFKLPGADFDYMSAFKDDMITIEKPAGFAFLADAFALHRGIPLLKGERLLSWTRYGLYDNGYSVDVTPGPVPNNKLSYKIKDDNTHQYIFRSVIESGFSQAPTLSLHAKTGGY